MGLFDSFNPNFASSPQFQQGLLAMALASGNPRQAAGIQGLLQMQMHQEDRAAKQALLNQKIAEQQKRDNFFGGLLSGGVANMTPEQVLQAKQYNVDAMPAVEYAKRGVQVQPGNGYIGQNGQFTYVPQVDKGIMLNPDGSAAQVNGYAQANAGIQGAQTQAQEAAKLPFDLARFQGQYKANADWTPQEVYSPTGEKIVRPRSAVLAPGASAPESAIRGQATGDMGGTLAQYKADIADIDKALQTPGLSKQDRQLLQGQRDMRVSQISRYFGDQQAAAKPDQTSGAGNVVELSPQQQAANEAARVTAVDTAKSNVGRNDAAMKDVKTASKFLSIANHAESLLKQGPTASGIGSLLDSGAAFFGQTTKGAELAQQLKGIGGWMVSNVPRMEGPQSNFDVANYQVMAGDVANDSLPIARRLSALQGIKTMMEDQIKLAGTSMQGGQQAPQENQLKPAKTVVRTGMYGGRKVVQYSDGTTDYAD